ncbi:MAG: glycoside hydrolase [Rubrivivax sp.]|nr:glycoside hydrolase [Rubrivivax sp.]
MGDEKLNRQSRRTVLKGGMALLGNMMLVKIARLQTSFKRLYIAPDDHTDYMWTGTEEQYRQAFINMLDYYLDLIDKFANEPSEHQNRWNCDGSFWMWTYEKNKPSTDFQRLIERIRSGHISVPLTALVACYGGAPAEAVLRGMYYPGRIERRYSLDFTLAGSMENQTLPYGLGALWAGAGAKYSWKGICGCASKVTSPGDREHEIYWWVGPDGSKILMKWYSLISNRSLGGYAEAFDPGTAVDLLDSKCFSSSKYNYGIAGAFGRGWDGLEIYTEDFVKVAKNKTNATRQVIVSNEEDFFEDFEATYGASLPSVSASFGNEWELYCVSMAEVSAQVKRAVEKLRSAEALATLVSLQNPGFMNGRNEARDLAWMNLGLYWEHAWTADGPVSRNARRDWQRRIAGEIAAYVTSLHTAAATALGGMIQKTGSNPRFFVFNPLSWTRTDIADLLYSPTGDFHVLDLSTTPPEKVPAQIVTVDGQTYLRILAQDIPPVGYKVFEVLPVKGTNDFSANAPSVNPMTGIIKNGIYEITVAPRGAITSLKDKNRGNREFAKNIGGYSINDLHQFNNPNSPPTFGQLEPENVGPVSATLRATLTSSSPLKHTTRITLIRNSNRIDIRNEINQNFSDVYVWRYGFNLNSPDVWHEEVGAVIRAKLLANGGHYSPRNARYDWLTLNHFADISDGTVGVTLSNADCYFMQLGASTPISLDTNTPQISPLVGGQVDGSNLGIPDQGGDTHFLQRFALQTHDDYNPAEAMKFALEHQNPLVTGLITGGDAYPETSYSLLTLSNPNVLLWAFKPADDGINQGLIARVWNLSSNPVDCLITLTDKFIAWAKHTTHIETPIAVTSVTNGALLADLGAHQLKTFLMHLPEFDERAYLPLVQRRNGF